MGKDFYEQYPLFRSFMDSVSLDFDVKSLCFEGPEEQLGRTRYTQPCMAAFAAGVTRLLKAEGIVPSAAAGLSLGEYSALCCAGVLDEKTLLETVALRGRAMEEASEGLECGMTAVLYLEREKLEQVCREASELGVVRICNCNCPGQLVISGEKRAVDRAAELAKEAGARRCMPLKVSGPFHTPLMRPAGEVLAAHFQTVSFGEMEIPVYFNCTGDRLAPGESIPELLVRQVQSPVLWEDTIRAMERDGIDTAVEIGPGKTLSGFFRKTTKKIAVYSIDTAEDFRKAVTALKEVQP